MLVTCPKFEFEGIDFGRKYIATQMNVVETSKVDLKAGALFAMLLIGPNCVCM